MAARLTISFEGAARTVTGSRHRILYGDKSWLFDCGLYQGHREEADRINRTFRFDPATLDYVVLSHAHLDHSGNVPTLVGHGYPGRVHVPPATGELCKAMLADSAFLMERDVDHVRRHRKENNGHRQSDPVEPLYTVADAQAAIERFETHPYHVPWELMSGVTVRYYDAGHILGSAVTTFEFQNGGQSFRLAMGGDLGRPDRPILRDPEVPPPVDALVLESTYGNRLHPDADTTQRDLIDAITRTVQRGGRVLVPAFAVGRAQELVATLHELMESKLLPSLPIYVDSPLAGQATDVFRHHPELFDKKARQSFSEHDGEPLGFARLRYTKSADESRALNEVTEPCIIISASGMCEGGRILHHLRHGLGDARNTVLFVGYQAEGTLGRRIRDGAEVVSVFGEPVHRRAEVRSLDGFSAHADQHELVDWVAKLNPRPKKVFLVHGDFEPAGVLAEKLTSTLGVDVTIPSLGDRFDLWN
jgi:metallo-beta-lactamase family protein